MIEFSPLDLSHKTLVQQYTWNSPRKNCDLTFANLFSWRFLYQTEIAETHHHLAFRFRTGGQSAYMLPVGDGPLKPVIETLMEDARQNGFPFRMFGVCSDMLPLLDELFPDQFRKSTDRDYADYVYLRSDLATLRGKKFQSKRNHINKFRTLYPDYSFKPLTVADIPQCLELAARWSHADNPRDRISLTYEQESIKTAFGHFEELDLLGGVLRTGGEIVGFTYGAPLNKTTFDTCVEKANILFEGSYAVLNQEFANLIPKQYELINREEDLGIEGLRKAKTSYHPIQLLEKYKIERT